MSIPSLLDRLGIKRPTSVRTIANGIELIADLGFAPKTVIDVGAAHGTHPLYNTFPQATHLLIDPVKEYQRSLDKIKSRYKKVIIANTLVGAKKGTMNMNVHSDHLEGSSVFDEQVSEFDGKKRQVPITTLDLLVTKHKLKGPYLIKIDTQGYELEVLKGATKTIKLAEYIVLETSFFEFYKGQPILSEVIRFMHTHGFEPYDLYDVGHRPLDGALAQVDVAFVKKDGKFRESNLYATVKDWQKLKNGSSS